jgi:Na+/proline symporter
MSVSSEKNAGNAIWTNALLSFFASFLFFGVGTALYVYYKNFPAQLDPTFQTDSIFPQFIASQLPLGIAGIVVAGVFAAAQSTISTSMNSISTAFTTDFFRRFNLLKTEKGYFKLARTLTFTFGAIGTLIALLFAAADIKSMWDSFMKVLGLFGGAMCGLFILGIFTKRTNGKGALIGALCGAGGLWWIQQNTRLSFLLYASIGIMICFVIGYMLSFIFPRDRQNIDGLTVFTLNRSKHTQE